MTFLYCLSAIVVTSRCMAHSPRLVAWNSSHPPSQGLCGSEMPAQLRDASAGRVQARNHLSHVRSHLKARPRESAFQPPHVVVGRPMGAVGQRNSVLCGLEALLSTFPCEPSHWAANNMAAGLCQSEGAREGERDGSQSLSPAKSWSDSYHMCSPRPSDSGLPVVWKCLRKVWFTNFIQLCCCWRQEAWSSTSECMRAT